MIFDKFNGRAPLARALAAAFTLTTLATAMAQEQAGNRTLPAGTSVPAGDGLVKLAPVVVTGNPLRAVETAAPVSVLDGDALTLRRGTTLGDTLNGLPGVSSSGFGPNSSRPIIRGLDGDRVRILNNSGATVDASSLSFDHAVAIDPLVIERVEVLRGPAALLYGGNATGGAVNAIDNRIPKASIDGVSGSAEARFGGADRERGASALVEAGNGRAALHVDVFGRETADLRVPAFAPMRGGTALPAARLLNSASRGSGGSVGGSLTFEHGYLGLSVDTYDNRYGVVVEPDVTIRMHRDHAAIAGEVRNLEGPVRVVRGQLGRTLYEHDEIEGSGAVGTTFLSQGTDGRIEAEHAPLGPLRGVVGAQFERLDFSALGEEAFVPDTRSRSMAVFAVEEAKWTLGTSSIGLRAERVRVESAGDADLADARFGAAAERRFSLHSASLSHAFEVAPHLTLSASLGASERAPTYYELFANGLHVATSAFEVGNPDLPTERSRNVELALQWKLADSKFRIGAYRSRYARFLALDSTGGSLGEVDDGGVVRSYPVYAFQAVRARLQGIELEASRRMRLAPWTVDLSSKFDLTRALNLDSGEPLPRIPPLRATFGIDLLRDGWLARAEVELAARQQRVPSTDVPTAGYGIVNLTLSKRLTLGNGDALMFAKLGNVGNTLAYNAASISTVRGLSPMAGRSLKIGMKLSF